VLNTVLRGDDPALWNPAESRRVDLSMNLRLLN
jgi:hypothetical protein